VTQNHETRVATAIRETERTGLHLVTKQKMIEENGIATFNDQE
jgi:hypothetical protein